MLMNQYILGVKMSSLTWETLTDLPFTLGEKSFFFGLKPDILFQARFSLVIGNVFCILY